MNTVSPYKNPSNGVKLVNLHEKNLQKSYTHTFSPNEFEKAADFKKNAPLFTSVAYTIKTDEGLGRAEYIKVDQKKWKHIFSNVSAEDGYAISDFLKISTINDKSYLDENKNLEILSMTFFTPSKIEEVSGNTKSDVKSILGDMQKIVKNPKKGITNDKMQAGRFAKMYEEKHQKNQENDDLENEKVVLKKFANNFETNIPNNIMRENRILEKYKNKYAEPTNELDNKYTQVINIKPVNSHLPLPIPQESNIEDATWSKEEKTNIFANLFTKIKNSPRLEKAISWGKTTSVKIAKNLWKKTRETAIQTRSDIKTLFGATTSLFEKWIQEASQNEKGG